RDPLVDRRAPHHQWRLRLGSTERPFRGPAMVHVGAGHRHATVRTVSVSRVSVTRSRDGAALVRRPDVHGGGVLRTVVHDDAGTRHATYAIGRDLAAAVYPDTHRQRYRAVGDRTDQRSAEPVVPAELASVCPRRHRRRQRVGRGALPARQSHAEAGSGGDREARDCVVLGPWFFVLGPSLVLGPWSQARTTESGPRTTNGP